MSRSINPVTLYFFMFHVEFRVQAKRLICVGDDILFKALRSHIARLIDFLELQQKSF